MDDTDKRVIKTYVWHKNKCFFVSTIERDSSAAEGPRRYNETLVWRYNWAKRERGALLYQESDMRGSISRHQCVVAALFRDGCLDDNLD